MINGTQLTQLETNGRSLYSLVNLVPGASSGQRDFQTPTPMGGDQTVSFNGQRIAHALYTVDGGEAPDRGGSGAIVTASLDSLSEFRVFTSNYSAEYGLVSGATVTTAVKSGTDKLHCSAWWFGRNDALDCAFTSSQQSDVDAYVQNSLIGSGTANTNILRDDPEITFDQAKWVNWTTPVLQ